MNKVMVYGLLSAALGLGVINSAHSLAVNTTPSRQSLLLEGFESGLDGWTSDPGKTGDNTSATVNTDATFVQEGKQSLKVDLTGVGDGTGSTDVAIEWDLANPVDLSDYHVMTFDVFVPDSTLFPDTPGGWFQPAPRVTTSEGTQSYGNRDLQAGWNHLSWVLQSDTGKDFSKLTFTFFNDSARPFSGPIYIDNVRAWKDPLPGLHADETILAGFNAATDAANLTVSDGFQGTINTDKQFVSEGTGSVLVDFGDTNSWHNNEIVYNLPTPLDVTKALALRLDVYVPSTSAPTDWWQVGFEANGDGTAGYIASPTYNLLKDQWETVEIPLTTDQATGLGNLTKFTLRRNSGANWTGPIYIDNLRIANGVTTPTVVKGDLNADGKVNIADATMALQFAVGNGTPTAAQIAAGDVVGGDGKIGIPDVTKILQAAIGAITL